MSSPFKDRLFRGYGPLIGFTAVFLAIALLVPSQKREVRVQSADSSSELASGDGPGADVEGASETAGEDGALGDEAGAAGGGADGTDGSGSGSSGRGGGSSGSGGAAAGGGAGGGRAAVAGCGNQQVPGDPYAPVCVKFSGNNGGATSRGVSGGEIVVTVRIGNFANGLLDALSRVTPAKIPDEPKALIVRTLEGLVDYFNQRFQFYGRKIKLQIYDGKGNPLTELTGGGQEGAQADALKVSQEYKAFADVSAVTPVYADALSSKGVVNIGAPYTSREWLSSRRPYAWSQFTDCSTAVESVSSYYATKLAGKPAALAGGDLKGKKRATAIVAPENSWYQECVNAGINQLKRAGAAGDLVLNQKYRVDIPSMSGQADTTVRLLKSKKVSTVICGCDPLFLLWLTAKAKEQNYRPEWMITGVALVDNDLIGQILEPDQWSRAFGISFSGPTLPQQNGLGYRAYKSVRKDEPSIGVDLIYNQLYLLAIGIQMAGPNLTPQSFETGMFAYPTHTGPYGTWGFGPNDYSTTDDAREIFYDPNAVSPYNRERGVYVDPNGGKRFPIGKWPATPPRSAAG